MFNKKQIKAIINTLKDRAIEGRPALQQVFEQGGYLWATNGYIALELGQVKDELKGKCIKLDALVGWYGTHKTKDTTTLTELMVDNTMGEPDMCKLLHIDYVEAHNPMFDMDMMNLATKFLGVSRIALEEAENSVGSKCYKVKSLEHMHVAHEAMEIKAYVMGLAKK